jgi:uncharacterized protein
MADPKPVALITGASSGIGAEFVRQLAHKGYDLVLVARRKDRLEQLSQTINRDTGVGVEILPADLSLEEGIKLVEDRIQDLPQLEILVNNAGFGIPGNFSQSDTQAIMAMLSVHNTAVVRITRAALPGMLTREVGYIINVSSLSALTAAAGSAMYAATKSFLNGFSDALATELYGTGIKVQALCPGFTRTEFHDSPAFEKYHDERRIPNFVWMSTEQVVRSSLRAIQHGQVIYVPGLGNNLAAIIGKTGLIRVGLKLYYLVTKKKPIDRFED